MNNRQLAFLGFGAGVSVLVVLIAAVALGAWLMHRYDTRIVTSSSATTTLTATSPTTTPPTTTQKADALASLVMGSETPSNSLSKKTTTASSSNPSTQQIQNAQNSITEAQNSVRAQVRNGYLISANAINLGAGHVMQISSAGNAVLSFNLPDQEINNQYKAEQEAVSINTSLAALDKIIEGSSFPTYSNTAALAQTTENDLTSVSNYLNLLTKILSEGATAGVISKSNAISYSSTLNTDNIQVNTALSALIAAETQEQEARTTLANLNKK